MNQTVRLKTLVIVCSVYLVIIPTITLTNNGLTLLQALLMLPLAYDTMIYLTIDLSLLFSFQVFLPISSSFVHSGQLYLLLILKLEFTHCLPHVPEQINRELQSVCTFYFFTCFAYFLPPLWKIIRMPEPIFSLEWNNFPGFACHVTVEKQMLNCFWICSTVLVYGVNLHVSFSQLCQNRNSLMNAFPNKGFNFRFSIQSLQHLPHSSSVLCSCIGFARLHPFLSHLQCQTLSRFHLIPTM